MEISLKYAGNLATAGELDFYDAAQAMLGFQRTLALTAHFVLNGEIITQAPALKGAEIRIATPRHGSWEIAAYVVTGFVAAGALSKDSVFGHVMWSVYDYIVSNTLGFHVEFDQTLFRSHQEILESRDRSNGQLISESSLDSLSEKTEAAVVNMHRPIVWSETAVMGRIRRGDTFLQGGELNFETYEYAAEVKRAQSSEQYVGFVSSYNVNTFKGRVYVPSEGRPIPFELAEHLRNRRSVDAITRSLRSNALEKITQKIPVVFEAFRYETVNDRLKSLYMTNIE